jgi:hypothetical protein
MRHDPYLFAEMVREMGYDTHNVMRIMLGEGYSWSEIAAATVPQRTIDERIERLRAAGMSIRTVAECVQIPKSTLHLRISKEARGKHNKRPNGEAYRMTQENVTAMLMALGGLTKAIESQQLEPLFRMLCEALDDVAAAVDDAADRIERATKAVAAKVDAGNKIKSR